MLVFFLRPRPYFQSEKVPRVPDYHAFLGILATETAEDLNVKAVRGLQGLRRSKTIIQIPQWGAGTWEYLKDFRRTAEEIGQWLQAEVFQVLWERQSQSWNLAKEMDLSSSCYFSEGWKNYS